MRLATLAQETLKKRNALNFRFAKVTSTRKALISKARGVLELR
jgi:hypothetical protein